MATRLLYTSAPTAIPDPQDNGQGRCKRLCRTSRPGGTFGGGGAVPRTVRLGFVVALVFAGLLACSREPLSLDAVPRRVSVHAMLLAGEDTVRVLVTRVGRGEAPLYWNTSEPVTGAEVQLSWGDEAIVLRSASEQLGGCTSQHHVQPIGAGCYTGVVPNAVRSGVNYSLHIRLEDGGLITGTASVPSPPDVHPQAETPTLVPLSSVDEDPGEPVHLQWDAPPDEVGSIGIALALHLQDCSAFLYVDEGDGPELSVQMFVSGQTEATVGVWTATCASIEDDRVPGEIRLTSYDRAYTGFLRSAANSNEQSAPTGFGVSGAVGVFAGAASATVPVFVKLH